MNEQLLKTMLVSFEVLTTALKLVCCHRSQASHDKEVPKNLLLVVMITGHPQANFCPPAPVPTKTHTHTYRCRSCSCGCGCIPGPAGSQTRASHELTRRLIRIQPAGISLSKIHIRIHTGKFPWVTCHNRSGTCSTTDTC